ncbi:MAG TPA: hypothetical protein DCP31_10250 [Cyanobacteria bacterium UBA8543]|nr:hypothetical protein [Cyanobacteria bacterium UBA8543]
MALLTYNQQVFYQIFLLLFHRPSFFSQESVSDENFTNKNPQLKYQILLRKNECEDYANAVNHVA